VFGCTVPNQSRVISIRHTLMSLAQIGSSVEFISHLLSNSSFASFGWLFYV